MKKVFWLEKILWGMDFVLLEDWMVSLYVIYHFVCVFFSSEKGGVNQCTKLVIFGGFLILIIV